ncbi:hypothetical protein E2C01_093194 [Portunus trituberculatus]|uniref:Uncharacterized protein n=1 Tax=Portunus trituberculatus TaxID=210409 RepID=A0A5B7JXG7_PORTR|nr:hypothetical protein [Portunus trituberculatus]
MLAVLCKRSGFVCGGGGGGGAAAAGMMGFRIITSYALFSLLIKEVEHDCTTATTTTTTCTGRGVPGLYICRFRERFLAGGDLKPHPASTTRLPPLTVEAEVALLLWLCVAACCSVA